jgi:hypothetical protein
MLDGRFFRGFAQLLEATIANAGPPEWIEWTLDMRNMQVHRARRLQLATVHPRPTGAATESGDPEVVSDVALHLPKSPAHSDIEVMVATVYEPLLSEDSGTTISGVLGSTVEVIAATCSALLRAWELRRGAPNLILQPLKLVGEHARETKIAVSRLRTRGPAASRTINSLGMNALARDRAQTSES